MRKSTYKEHSTPGEIAFIIELILRPNKVTDNYCFVVHPFPDQEHSFSRLFVPKLCVSMMELLFSRPFVLWNIRSLKRPWNIHSPDVLALGNLLFLYQKRETVVQNGQICFYVNTQTTSESHS